MYIYTIKRKWIALTECCLCAVYSGVKKVVIQKCVWADKYDLFAFRFTRIDDDDSPKLFSFFFFYILNNWIIAILYFALIHIYTYASYTKINIKRDCYSIYSNLLTTTEFFVFWKKFLFSALRDKQSFVVLFCSCCKKNCKYI